MIKLIDISPLNTTQTLSYECKNCGDKGIIHLANIIINTDNNGNPEVTLEDYNCPQCGNIL